MLMNEKGNRFQVNIRPKANIRLKTGFPRFD